MRRIIQIVTFGSLVLCALSFLGFLASVFDSLAVIRPLLWGIAAIGTFWLPAQGPKEFTRGALILMAFPFLSVFDRSEEFDNPAIRIYQHNLLYTNTAPDLQMVANSLKPDIITLQEIKTARETVQNLEGYPHQQICDFASVGDVGILSKRPFLQQGCAEGEERGFAWGQIENDKGEPVTVVSMHLHWPFPFKQSQQLDEILPQIEKLPQPIILAGDLNQVLWSHSVRRISKATQSPVLDGLRFTLVRFPLFLPIDHAFGQGVYHVERLPRYGSDHNALMVDFKDWPQAEALENAN